MLDLLNINGRVIDGTGSPWYWIDVAIAERIAKIGKLAGRDAKWVINADGRFVPLDFIDLHTHSDLQLLQNPLHECKIRQGVTTDGISHDGLDLAPITSVTKRILQTQPGHVQSQEKAEKMSSSAFKGEASNWRRA